MTYVPKPKPHGPRGFAAMSPEKRAAISSKGGKRAHEVGHAHEFTPTEARRAGRRGGEAVARDREHMAYIGLLGGRKRGENAVRKRQDENLGGCADLST
jgi:general stress protein YciG